MCCMCVCVCVGKNSAKGVLVRVLKISGVNVTMYIMHVSIIEANN